MQDRYTYTQDIYITHTQRIVLFKERNTDSGSGQIRFLTNQSLFTF